MLDLSDKEAVERVFEEHQIDRCTHLAALAHTKGGGGHVVGGVPEGERGLCGEPVRGVRQA